MPVLPRSIEIQGEISAIRRDIHAHPELAYEENRTSDIVAAKLAEWGLEVTRGLGKTGLVGTLRKGNSVKAIGLRADMDCLPMDETNDFEHASKNPGRMHACGHDGHTAMLLGAAKVLSEKRDFEGAVHFIFQPAEEGGGGGRAMIDDGLFEKFPCDAVFAIHNKPGLPLGMIATKPGALLAAADRWDLRITGKGGHAAHPHLSLDPLIVAANLVRQPQHGPLRLVGRHRRFRQGRLGLQCHPDRRPCRRHDAHHDAGSPQADRGTHPRDLRGCGQDVRREDRR
jgi:amidohydrolase